MRNADGRCARCDGPLGPLKSPLLIAGVLLVVALLVLSISSLQLRGDVRTLRSELRSLAAARAQDRRSATSLQTSVNDVTNAFSQRLGALEVERKKQPNQAEVIKRVDASVFLVAAGEAEGSAWVSSSSNGTSRLITNFHVVERVWLREGRDVTVRKGDQSWPGRIEKVSQSVDLAVLSVPAAFPVLPRAPQKPTLGDPVIVSGAPLGLEGSVSTGIVSAFRDENGDQFIQFSAPVSPGSSGGPVVNQAGEVIGVTLMKAVAEGAEGLGFAIPIDRACEAVGAC